jgi:DOPA 4,5-dioxygenase
VPDRIRDYHAHIYFDAATADIARSLRTAIGERFDAELGNWNEKPVGPHPTWSAEIIFPTEAFAELVPWLSLNRGGLSVLVHPNTGDDLADHTEHAMWLGSDVKLELAIFRAGA